MFIVFLKKNYMQQKLWPLPLHTFTQFGHDPPYFSSVEFFWLFSELLENFLTHLTIHMKLSATESSYNIQILMNVLQSDLQTHVMVKTEFQWALTFCH